MNSVEKGQPDGPKTTRALPDNPDDARAVLKLAHEILENFLAVEKPQQERPQLVVVRMKDHQNTTQEPRQGNLSW